jgi:outer membrane murein-binding lipoprotein Lpp
MLLLGALGPSLEGLGGSLSRSWEVLGPLGTVLAAKVGQVSKKVGQVSKKVGQVSKKVGPVSKKVGQVSKKVGQVSKKVGQVSKKVGQSFGLKQIPKRAKNDYQKYMMF